MTAEPGLLRVNSSVLEADGEKKAFITHTQKKPPGYVWFLHLDINSKPVTADRKQNVRYGFRKTLWGPTPVYDFARQYNF